MAVDTSRVQIAFPPRQWSTGREHMIESLAKLEGKPAEPFFLARVNVTDSTKRPLYPDSPTSVVNSLMSPYSTSPPEKQNDVSELRGQQSTMESVQQQAQVPQNNSGGGESRANSAPRKSFNAGGGPAQSGSESRSSQGDDGDDGRGRKNGRPVVVSPEGSQSPDLARERELAFEGNQQQPKIEAPTKQDFFTKIKIAMCAAPQTAKSDMENQDLNIGWPTNVKHLVHVSFDRFKGFVGLPEDMGEDQKNAPGASLSVFGVKPDSLQVTWDNKHKHCVPTVLVMLQERLVAKNGLRTEGVFRIAAESAEEEYIRSKLNKGEEPPITDVHVIAGLIKAWFRELPAGVLDALTPEQVAAAQKEPDVVALVKQLPEINKALLDWAVDLMADVVEQQSFNKMNSRNIAMVFAPNMTQVMDPLKALMHAVKVMNLLKVLIEKRLRERRQAAAEEAARVEREMLRLAEEEEIRIQREEEEKQMLVRMEEEEKEMLVRREEEQKQMLEEQKQMLEEEARLREQQAEKDEGVHTENGERGVEGGNAPVLGRMQSEDEFFEADDSMKAADSAALLEATSHENGRQAEGSIFTPPKDEDPQVTEAMSLPVSRAELLVLVTELEKKDELTSAPEEEESGELAVVREKVDIALEHDEEEEAHVTSASEGQEVLMTSASKGQEVNMTSASKGQKAYMTSAETQSTPVSKGQEGYMPSAETHTTSALDGLEKEPWSADVFGEEPI